MQKYFIADWLTAAKLIPAVVILTFLRELDSGAVFLLFGAGELLDALDGMAAKKWPHPKWTEKLWFRKRIKLIESGLDLLLAIVTLIFIIKRVSSIVGIIILAVATVIGLFGEIYLYGFLFGTPETAKPNSLFIRDPEKAERVVGARLFAYIVCLATIILLLIWAAPWDAYLRILATMVSGLIGGLVFVKKLKDGRLKALLAFLGIK